jgi:hypothetical protein
MSGDYPVGYGRPPQHSRFKPGQSGNPRGRPKGSKGVHEVIAGALNEKVTVEERGKRRSMTKLELGARQMANKTASGDVRAFKMMLELQQQFEALQAARDASQGLSAAEIKAQDTEILQLLRDNLSQLGPEAEGAVDV